MSSNKKQMYAKDSYLLFSNLVMTDQKKWEEIKNKSGSSLTWSVDINKDFEVFKNWNTQQKRGDSFLSNLFYGANHEQITQKKRCDVFLSNLFYGANLEHVDQEKAITYLTRAVYDFYFFLAENMYHRLIMEKLTDEEKKQLSVSYEHLFANEVQMCEALESKLSVLNISLDKQVEQDVKKRLAEEQTIEKNEVADNFSQVLSSMEIKLEKLSKQACPRNSFFNTSSEQEIVGDEKVIFGIDTMGSSYAISKLLKHEQKETFKLILIGGQNAVWDFFTSSESRYYSELTEANINFTCYTLAGENVPRNNHFKKLSRSDYSPCPLHNYKSCIYDLIFLHCIKTDDTELSKIVKNYCC